MPGVADNHKTWNLEMDDWVIPYYAIGFEVRGGPPSVAHSATAGTDWWSRHTGMTTERTRCYSPRLGTSLRFRVADKQRRVTNGSD